MFDQGRVGAHLPQRFAPSQLADELRLGVGETGVFDRRGDLVGGLVQDDLGGRIGDESLGDLGRGGAVIGLGGEVRDAVRQADVGGAVAAAEFEAAL